MFKFSCKDLNLNCDYTAIGENRVVVMQASMKHTGTDHAETTTNFSEEQSWEYLKTLEVAVQLEQESISRQIIRAGIGESPPDK
jgi:predicted small metal-binding protein